SAGLSPIMQDTVFESIAHITAAGISILMVEQNASRCLQISDRGYVLDQGRNAYTGTGSQLLNDPKVIELYLGTLAKAADASNSPVLVLGPAEAGPKTSAFRSIRPVWRLGGRACSVCRRRHNRRLRY